MADYTFRGIVVPAELIESLTAYVRDGLPLGSFLEACVDNNLSRAVNRADDDNLSRIPAITGWLYCEAPASCWGKAGDHDRHCAKKREEREKEKTVEQRD